MYPFTLQTCKDSARMKSSMLANFPELGFHWPRSAGAGAVDLLGLSAALKSFSGISTTRASPPRQVVSCALAAIGETDLSKLRNFALDAARATYRPKSAPQTF